MCLPWPVTQNTLIFLFAFHFPWILLFILENNADYDEMPLCAQSDISSGSMYLFFLKGIYDLFFVSLCWCFTFPIPAKHFSVMLGCFPELYQDKVSCSRTQHSACDEPRRSNIWVKQKLYADLNDLFKFWRQTALMAKNLNICFKCEKYFLKASLVLSGICLFCLNIA